MQCEEPQAGVAGAIEIDRFVDHFRQGRQMDQRTLVREDWVNVRDSLGDTALTATIKSGSHCSRLGLQREEKWRRQLPSSGQCLDLRDLVRLQDAERNAFEAMQRFWEQEQAGGHP